MLLAYPLTSTIYLSPSLIPSPITLFTLSSSTPSYLYIPLPSPVYTNTTTLLTIICG